jgi:hypothetical protein
VPGPPSLGQPVHGVTAPVAGSTSIEATAPFAVKKGNGFVGQSPAR